MGAGPAAVSVLLAAAAVVAASGAIGQQQESDAGADDARSEQAPESGESTDGAAGDDDADAAAQEGEPPYMVECGPDPESGGNACFVDRDTYVGWRTFHAVCHTCHAQDAVGSTFAPALLPRVREIDKARFVTVVDEGFEGQMGVMPAWGDNPNVNRFYDELWAYLRARADGVLAPGRPKRLPQNE